MSPVSTLFVSIKSSRRLQDMSSRRLQDMSSRRLQNVFSVTIFCFQDVLKTSSRRLQDVLQEIFKTSSRRLGRRKMLRWRRVEDVFKTCLQGVFKTSSRPTNVCWDITPEFLGLRIRNIQGIIFIWTQTYRGIFKSALVYL